MLIDPTMLTMLDDPTVLIARGCANAMFIFRLLDLYSAGAVGIRGTIERLELADAGLFDLAVLALDLELKERMQVFGDKQARENTNIDRYFGGGPYPIGRDIALVELSCSKEVTGKLKHCSSRSLGNFSFYWNASNTARRVFVTLEFGSTASPFPEDSPATYDAVFGYMTEIMTRAYEYKFDAYAEPQELPLDYEYWEASLKSSQEAVDFYGATRLQSNLIGTKMSASFFDCQVTERCALIVVARIVLVPGRRHGTGTTATADLSPYVVLLVLANAYDRVLAYYVAEERGSVKPAGLQVMPQGVLNDWQHMRRSLLAYLGRDNLLVGFNVTWTLTALQLAVDTMRVVDIGLEPAYQRWCCQMSQRYKHFVDMLVPNLCVPFDRHWPAILLGDLEL